MRREEQNNLKIVIVTRGCKILRLYRKKKNTSNNQKKEKKRNVLSSFF